MIPIEQLTGQTEQKPQPISPERQARIQLRQVDRALSAEGVDEAIEKLRVTKLIFPFTVNTSGWIREYEDMLEAWQSGLALEVLDEFNEYGCRRARDLAHRCLGWIEDEKLLPYYRTCERVLGQMSRRKLTAARDEEVVASAAETAALSLQDAIQQ